MEFVLDKLNKEKDSYTHMSGSERCFHYNGKLINQQQIHDLCEVLLAVNVTDLTKHVPI